MITTPVSGIGHRFQHPVHVPAGAAVELGAHQIAQRVHLVHPHRDFLVLVHLAFDQGDVHMAVDGVAERHQPEFTVPGIQRMLGHRLDGLLVERPVLNQVGDGTDLDAASSAKLSRSGRRAMEPSSFITSQITPAASATGHHRQIAGCLAPGAAQHAARLRHQRENMPRLDDVRRLGVFGGGGLHGAAPGRRRKYRW